jgi:archaeal preflagellin peptidase FlaK
MDWSSIIKVAVAFIVLVLASRSDWKTREASDAYWLFLGAFGMTLLAAQIFVDGADPLYYLVLIPIAIFFLDIFWDRPGMFENGINPLPIALYAAGFAILGFLIYQFGTASYLWGLLIIPIMFFLFMLLYLFDVIKGGADAKALIALAIVFPTYPVFGDFPLVAMPSITQLAFPYPLLILFNAAILVVAMPVVLFFYNLKRRDVRVPAMFFGYVLPIEEVSKKFVWPMERMDGGARKITMFPHSSDEGKEQLAQLEAAGATSIWVTPKIPFLIPITASVLFSAIVGNVLFLLFP